MMRGLGRAVAAALLVAGLGGAAGAVEPSATVPPEVEAYAATLGDALATSVFEGDFSGDGAPDAMSVIYYAGGGNAAFLDVSLFERVGSKLVHKRVVENVFGENPRDVAIAPGRVEVTMTVLKPGEPRCCPTGKKRYTIRP